MARYRTPLRYPGGKQRLAPFIREVLEANELIGADYVEPYAGGAGIAIELLLSDRVGHIHLNDSSGPIYAFWNSVINRTEELCRRITDTPLTVEEWKKQREVMRHAFEQDEIDVGFSVLYLNRCNRSGVLTGGLIGGLAQTGAWLMDARFPRSDLVRRIEAVAARGQSIALHNLDAEKFMLDCVPLLPERTLVYCDPPYFSQTSQLYLNQYKAEDHERVARVIQERLARKWLVSYDDAPEIQRYYNGRNCFIYSLQYSARRAYKGKEIFIFSDDLIIPAKSSLPYIDEALRQRRQAARA